MCSGKVVGLCQESRGCVLRKCWVYVGKVMGMHREVKGAMGR
jgi:hypothetical protein